MEFEEEYIGYLGSLLESVDNEDAKVVIKEIGDRFISLLEARGGNYNKFWTMHVGEGYGEHKFGDRIRSGGKKADMLADYQLKLVDPKSEENQKLERKVINDFTKEYGIRVQPEYFSDGKLKDAVFRDTVYINNDGDIYIKGRRGGVLPVGQAQQLNPPHQDGEELYAEPGDSLPDELMDKYTEMRNDAIEARMSWYNEKAAYYRNQASVGDEYTEDDDDPKSSFERSLVGPNAQPLGTNKELGTEFNKKTSGSEFGEGNAPRTIEKTERNTSVGLGNGLIDEVEAFDEIIESIPGLENSDLRKVINTVNSGRVGDTVMVSTINNARKYLHKLATPSRVPALKSAVEKVKSAPDDELSKDLATALNIVNELILNNLFKKDGERFGVNSTLTTFKKLLPPLEDYTGEKILVNKRNVNAIRDNLVGFVDNFIGDGEMKDEKFANDSALVPKLYNLLTDIAEGALGNA